MSEYNRRDVLKTGTGVALITGGISTTSGNVTATDGTAGPTALSETETPAGWVSPYGNARSANYIANGPEFETGAFETAWTFEKAKSDRPYETGGPDPTHIAVADGTVYSGAANMDEEGTLIDVEGVVALDAEDGSVQWQNEEAFGAPAVTDEAIYCVSSGELHALDRTDGSHKWRVDIDNDRSIASDSPTVAHGAVFLYDWTTHYAFEADDGSLRWRLDTGEINSRGFWQAPAVDNDFVYVPTGEIRALDPMTGETVWEIPRDGVDSPAVAVNSTTLAAAGDDSITIYDLETREEIASVPAAPGDTLALGEGVLVQDDRDGNLIGIDLETGGQLWEGRDGGREPVIVGDTVYYYATDTDSLTALDKLDGTKTWEFETGHTHPSPTVIAGTEQLYLLGKPELKAYRNPAGPVGDGDEDRNQGGDSETSDGEDGSDAGDNDGSTDTGNGPESDDTGPNGADTDESTGDSSDDEADSNEGEDGSDDAEGTPGFGVTAGLAGTVGAAVLATRRLLSIDDPTGD